MISGEYITSITIPSYAYTYIKVGFLKQLVISKPGFKKLKQIDNIKQYIEILRLYYPGILIKFYTIEEIEEELLNTYIKLIGKIMYYSPKNMRVFLNSFLLKFEIKNIKLIILGTILNMNTEEKLSLVNELVEKYLNNLKFLKELSEINALDEIQLFLSHTRYNRAIREGLLYYNKTNETFVLESFLDQIYYESLNKELKNLDSKEREILEPYIKYITEIYNVNMIYRGVINKIDKKLLSQFLIKSSQFLDLESINLLLKEDSIENFVSRLNFLYKNVEDLKGIFKEIDSKEKHIIIKLEKIFIESYFRKFKLKIDDIAYMTIFSIIEVLIKKDMEIRFKIIPRVVKIIHKKFKILNENQQKLEDKNEFF